MHTFDRAMAYFHVEQYLNSVLHDPNLVSYLNKMSSSCVTGNGSYTDAGDLDLVPDTINFFETPPAGSPLASSVEHLKYCIDVLVFFEKKVTLEEKGLFSRIPQSFYRGELVWDSPGGKSSNGGGHRGADRKVKCYACGCLNSPMKPNEWCKLCDSCGVVLYMPPSSVSTKTNEWYSSVMRFRQSLQKWICTCLQSLLRAKSLSNMPYILMHIMYLPRIATEERSWVLRFLQFPRGMVGTDGTLRLEWNEDLVDHYLAMMHLVFHPEKLRRMAILVSSGPSTAISVKSQKLNENGLVSPEWVLLENPDMLDRYFLSDDDFVAVLNQFPNSFAFEQLFRCNTDVKKCYSRALTLVLEFTNSLRIFQEFEKLPSRVAQLLGEVLSYAAQLPDSVSSRGRSDDAAFYPTLFDQLFLTALNGLMLVDCNRVAWKYLSCFPFGSLTEPAKWDVLALLLFNIPHVPADAKSASGWMRFMNTRSVTVADTKVPVRQILYDLIASDTGNAVHLLSAVAKLAASCPLEGGQTEKHSDLVSVAVHELFVAGFTVVDCKNALGVDGERAAAPISQICLAHPWIISLLITLLFQYHECAETWTHVFETFPVNRWVPTMHDLSTLQEWLQLDETSSPRGQLARFLLDHINWEYDVKRGQLFTPATIHRQVALTVAESLVLYKTRRERAAEPAAAIVTSGGGAPQKLEVTAITKSIRRALWLDIRVDFEKWCWKLILKLKFYSPKTHEPYLKLIDVQHDRSREALTLRRWFAGVSNSSPRYPDIPFYASLEDEVLRWGEQEGSIDSGRESNRSGAPIQADITIHEATPSSEPDATSTARTTESIVAYVICQMTSFLFTDRMDRWEPLLVLLKRSMFPAAVKVIENILPVLSRLNTPTISSGDDTTHRDDGDGESDGSIRNTLAVVADQQIDVCMAAIQTLSINDLLDLLRALHQFSYINAEELHWMQEILHKGYIGGWESTAKARIQAKLRFIRICSRFLHPVVLPALINESFPESSPVALTTSALFHGAMSWLSTALRGEVDPSSSASASSATFALSVRNSSLTATASASGATSVLKSAGMCTASARALSTWIESAFEYSTDDTALTKLSMMWLNSLLRVPYWFNNNAFRHLVDVLVRCSMKYDRAVLQQSGDGTSKVGVGAVPMLFDIVTRIQMEFDGYCHELKQAKELPNDPNSLLVDIDAGSAVSFLPGSSLSAPFSSIFSGVGDGAQYVEGCPSLALWLLLIETRQELPLFSTMGQLMVKCEPKTIQKVEKMTAESKLASALAELGLNTSPIASPAGNVVSRPLRFGHTTFESLVEFRIYRWCAYCLELPEDEPCQILYWQVLFALYFACVGSSHVFGHYFLERTKRMQLRTELQVKLRQMTHYCSNQAQLVLTTGGTGAVGVPADLKEQKYAHFVTLSQVYTAMDAWLEDPDPNNWVKANELVSLPRHYETKRLEQVLSLSDALLNTGAATFSWGNLPLWVELCDLGDSSRPPIASGEVTNFEASAPDLSNSFDGTSEDDGFAFVEEAAELARRHSSFGGMSNANTGVNIRPLPLVREFMGPSTLTVLPKVEVSTSMDSCVVTPSMPLNQNGLKGASMKFSENMSVLVALDAEMIDHVSQLYVSKPRSVTQSQACMEGTNCRSPAQFRFEFLEWSIDSRLSDAIEAILSQAERCDLKSMLMSNVTSLLMEHHDVTNSEESGAGKYQAYAVDDFLKLDADGMMLSLQILLIDQIVYALDAERQKIAREVQSAESKPLESTDGEEDDGSRLQRKLDRLNEKGLEWFRLLTSLDTKLARMVPPLREVLWRSIKKLGMAFVCVDERETCTLLQLMLDDPSRINLLSECFFPAGAPSRFVEMFSKLMSTTTSSKLSSEEKLILLRRFDFRAWLATKRPHTPTKFDRETILCIILGDVSSQFIADRGQTARGQNGRREFAVGGGDGGKMDNDHLRSVLMVYATTIRLICGKHLEDHVEKVLHALVGVHDDYHFQTSVDSSIDDEPGTGSKSHLPRPVDAVVWESLAAVPLESWQGLPFTVIESCVTFLSQHMTTLRWQSALPSASVGDGHNAASGSELSRYPIVQWERLGVLKHVLDLFTILCRVAPERQKWELICQFFEPVLSTLYQPATTTETSTINAPWSDQDALSTGTTLCSCFVATCSEYLKAGGKIAGDSRTLLPSGNMGEESRRQNAKLSEIWMFYLSVLVPHAPVHVCKHFHQFLTRLAWEHWCLTLEIVRQMRELIESEKQQLRLSKTTSDSSHASPYPFVSWLVRDILCRTKWKTTEEWLSTQSDEICSSFLLEYAKLCIDLVLDLPHFWPQQNQAQRGRMVAGSSSSNVLPPYFVNFVKQQAALWSRWFVSDADLNSLLQFALDAFQEPLQLHSGNGAHAEVSSARAFPAAPSTVVMQDAFARLQLALRLLAQVTTVRHSMLSKKATFSRVNLFLGMLFDVFGVNDLERLDGNIYTSDRSAWLMVLYGASCTVLYEKLDEIVQSYRRDIREDASHTGAVTDATAPGQDNNLALSEADLTTTLMGVLRFCNLSLVEHFFRLEQQQGGSNAGGKAAMPLSLNWSKCGNVLFVEIDSLVRDFASNQKQQHANHGQWNAAHHSSDTTAAASADGEGNRGDGSSSTAVATSGRSPAEAIGTPLGRLLWSFLGFRGGELACLASCGRAIASVHVMGQVAEKSIEKWIIEDRRGSWDDLALRLKIPELSEDEFETACLEQGKLMTLQVLFLQHLRKAPVLTESFAMGMLSRLIAWMEKLHFSAHSANGGALTEMKVLFFAAEVVNFVCKTLADVLPSTHKKQVLRQLAELLLTFGHERTNSGLMKAIGMGGSLKYNVEFHVSCLAVGIFLRLQTRASVPLRVEERIPFKVTRTTEKHIKSLEHLLATKDCIQLAKRMEWMLEFVKSSSRSLADQDEFFVSLFSRMYPSHPWLLAKCLQ